MPQQRWYDPQTPQPHHRHVDVAQCEVVHSKVRGNLDRHSSHDDGIAPELRVVQDIGQANQGHILGEGRRM